MKKTSHVELTFLLDLFLPILVYLPFYFSPIVWGVTISRVVGVMWIWGLIFALHSIKGKEYIERIKRRR
jgi:hypothetical protein